MKIIRKINNICHSHSIPLIYDVVYPAKNCRMPVIIFSHGYKSFKDWGTFNLIADFFARKGFVFVKFNFSHNGTTPKHPDLITDEKSFSENTIEKELIDLNYMIEQVRNLKVVDHELIDPEEIYLLGHSRGGCISILAAKENKSVKKLVTWSAFIDFQATWAKFYDMEEWKNKGYNYRENKLTGRPLPLSYELYLNYLENEERFNLRKAISSIAIPFMVVHGLEDNEIGFEEAIEMKKLNNRIKLNLVPYSNHNFGSYHKYPYNYLPPDTEFICQETAWFLGEA